MGINQIITTFIYNFNLLTLPTMKKIFHFLLIGLLGLAFTACNDDAGSLSPQSDANIGGNSGTGGSLARMVIVDQVMYMVDQSSIQVFDISTANEPRLVQVTEIFANNIETIFNYGDYLYLGSSNGMYIYSIEERFAPTYMSMATHVNGCDPVVSDGTFAYVTVRNTVQCNQNVDANILEIYNVEQPDAPQWVSTTQMDEPIGLAIDGDYLFVCDDALELYDVSDRSQPKLIKSFPSDAHDIIINGNIVLTVDDNGVNQYLYDRANLDLTHLSKILM